MLLRCEARGFYLKFGGKSTALFALELLAEILGGKLQSFRVLPRSFGLPLTAFLKLRQHSLFGVNNRSAQDCVVISHVCFAWLRKKGVIVLTPATPGLIIWL